VSTNRYLSDEISERKLAEKQLTLKHKELVHSAKLATIGQMSTTLSHEYNQPLAAMRTYAENAQKLIDLGQFEPVKDNLARIIHQTDRMGQLSKTLLSFAGKPNQPMGKIDVLSAVQEAKVLTQSRLKKAGIQFDYEVEPGLTLKGHSLQFSQVTVNLITNAIDALTQEETPKGRIVLSAQTKGDVAILMVEDDGPGIDHSILDQLFEPFVTTKSSGKGLGLGLSIIRDIVHDHEGQLSLSVSNVGGAAFRIEWPIWKTDPGTSS
jgi:two-component system C4-dicarboxylate transport sensor histidine kinase DctB